MPRAKSPRRRRRMSPKRFRTTMIETLRGKDPEAEHMQADKLMCELLRSLGYGEGVTAFETARNWYA